MPRKYYKTRSEAERKKRTGDTIHYERGKGFYIIKKRYVQVYNPLTNRWVKIDRDIGKVVAHKQSPGPYKNVPKYKKKKTKGR